MTDKQLKYLTVVCILLLIMFVVVALTDGEDIEIEPPYTIEDEGVRRAE